MGKTRKLKASRGRPITKYFRLSSQDQENEVQDRNRCGIDASDSSQVGPLAESPFANANAAPGGLTVEKTLQFIRDESKEGSGPAFLYSQEDPFEQHTPVARAPKKDEINSSEWRGWLKGCEAGTPKQVGTPRKIPWECSPWTPKQAGSYPKRKLRSGGKKADESVVRMVTSLDARLKNLYPSPALEATQSRGNSSRQLLHVKSNSPNDGSHPRKMRRMARLPSLEECSVGKLLSDVQQCRKIHSLGKQTEETVNFEGYPKSKMGETASKDPIPLGTRNSPAEDWSDEDFLYNIPLELLEKPQAVVRRNL